MRIIKTDLQARAVLHLVSAMALVLAGLIILLYRLVEPTQLLLYHTVSSSHTMVMVCLGGAMLLRCFGPGHMADGVKARVSIWGARVLAVVALAACVDGIFFHYFDPFESDLHPVPFVLFAVAALTLLMPSCAPAQRSDIQTRVIRASASFGLLLAASGLLLLIPHIVLEQPILARHPMGSLVVAVTMALTGFALYATHYSGRREIPALARSSGVFTGLIVTVVVAGGLTMFDAEMDDIRLRGEQAVENLNSSRRVKGEDTINLFRRLAERWENYPHDEHDRLMELDVRTYLEQVRFLDALILLDELRTPVWERRKNESENYLYLLASDPQVRARLTEDPGPVQLIVPEHHSTQQRAKLLLRLPVHFYDTPVESEHSLVAVLDVQTMLASSATLYESDIYTFTEMRDGRLLDHFGHWVTDETQEYLEHHALFLTSSELTTRFSSGTPIYSYLYDLSELQSIANLQILIVVAGLGLVLLVVLAVERNTTLEEQGDQLQYQAEHDALTGLLNRNSIEKHLADHFGDPTGLTVLFIDLDGFTLINDSLGLQVGDELLRTLAQRLQANQPLRSELARFASDEFLLVLHGLTDSPERIEQLANEMMAIVAQPYRIGSQKIYLTASIGVAHQTADQRMPLELIQRADMAMHQAKKLGYNHVQYFDKSMALRLQASAGMRSGLQEAIENDKLQLHYQPIVRCNDEHTVGVEALLRWETAPGEFISPAEFIPLAEMTGQIVPLSEWVLRQACADAIKLRERGDYRVAVNVSAVHFNRANFIDFVLQTIKEYNCKPEWIELEMTESILLENTNYAISQLQTLRSHGISIALDDFGTGFSSLSYLKRLPIDKVKIDRSFIAGIRSHKSDRVLISSVIKIAQSLNFAVVAEGVETPHQAQFVTELGTNYMQGYYFGRPVPLDDL
ncbi:putative bifunctional diguanylate cyclase/phosphodiesterase [Pseudidiomarina salinarum]|uniref:putative bifunctional diguanylate cyclase/phosphodiesterase n=1 Tax=Pseudidiomarina salinarum TaxID=435908 RepID=UPI0009FEF1E3|nr:bifunctional diguanylate cyclase/phosphodiesterase [Pseudidiomarina salinarum]RUO70865.1 bifunctional diguanylate cyclase/phosphodiesterase [Pseudidiomarina salinarum]